MDRLVRQIGLSINGTRSLTYRPALKPALRLPAVYSARIESNGQYVLLDEHGRFKVRNLFDTRSKEDAAHA